MTWFRVDDGFYDHPKVDDLSLAAVGLWTKAGSWCARYLTNGKIPLSKIRSFGGTEKLAQELIDADLWLVDETSYQFHDWQACQDSKSDVEDRRAVDAQRKRLQRETQKRVAVLTRDKLCCVYCASPVTVESAVIDHVMPVSRGGSNGLSNLATSCVTCNSSKGDKTPEEWKSSGLRLAKLATIQKESARTNSGLQAESEKESGYNLSSPLLSIPGLEKTDTAAGAAVSVGREPDPVFVHWVEVMAKGPNTKLIGSRKAKLNARRKDGYTDEELCRAVDGCRLSPFHMGQNGSSQVYNDLATILRDSTTVDAHIARTTGGPGLFASDNGPELSSAAQEQIRLNRERGNPNGV